MMQKPAFLFSIILAALFFVGCGSKDYTPKKKAYPRINFPERKGFKTFTNDICPFTFEYPDYAEVDNDSTFFHEKTVNPCWYNIEIKKINATLHLTYYDI